MCELTSWIPSAVADALRDHSAQPILQWLTVLRASIEEYDPLITVRPESPASESETDSPDSAFDEILSQLGKEIYKLDEYHRNLLPSDEKVSLSILNLFDQCLEQMTDKQTENGCSDGDSTISDVSFVTSTQVSARTSVVNEIFDKGDGTPVPPPRTRLKTASIDMEVKCDKDYMDAKSDKDSSDSESTCWSYKECSDLEVIENTYASVWSHSSGYHNSDDILRRVLSQNHATVSRLSFDTANEFEAIEYPVYTLQEVGDRRCVDINAVMTPQSCEKPADDGYEPVRDAITDENIYEEIEFGYSYTDEGCSCGTSIEVESCSMSASSDGVGRDSPLYANLRDHDAYAITPDVIFWKNLLLDPYYIEDEEDEWITPEESAMYSREQRPMVIPRITQYRTPRRDPRPNVQTYLEDNIPEQGSLKSSRHYDRLQNWSPTSERSRADFDRSFSKANSDSPPISRIPKKWGGSTENLLTITNPRRPNNLQIPASSSGDSLDVEMRDRPEPGYRNRKSKSMMAHKHIMRSPVPTPRQLPPQFQTTTEASVLHEGQVKKTKFFEGGKKSKKNWTDCYMILTTTALVFYKDQKTYFATRTPKPPGTPPSPTAPRAEMVMPLKNMRVLQCTPMYTRRHTRSLVLMVNYDQYLIQDETEEGARRWHQAIQRIIYTQFPQLSDSPTLQYQSSNTDLESLGRTPPTSRNNRTKQKAGGSSNEDLSDSTENSIPKSDVRSRLRKFFAKRPTMESLVKKGIYKDEPVFGRKLDEVCRTNGVNGGLRVPEFVVACIKEIEKDPENMCTDGLYRASGNLSQVQKIRLEIDQNNLSVIENNADIHVLTGSLKLFFRELKEPLIPCSMFDRVLAACSIKPKEAKLKEFREIIDSLPQCNRDTLKYLLEHLLRVTQYSEQNRMHTANLAIVFGPTLLWAPAEQAHNIAVDCIQQNNVVDILLNEFNEIFVEDNNGKGKKKA